MKEMDQDIMDLMAWRVHDIAGITPPSLTIYLNSEPIHLSDFIDYFHLFTEHEEKED